MTALQTLERKRAAAARAKFFVQSHCPQCAATIEQALRTTDGVYLAFVSPVSGETVVDYDPSLMTSVDVQEAIEAAGFIVFPA